MNIVCTICSDRITAVENSYATHCGHMFHYHCLKQWIDKSKSCPQCRTKVTQNSMFRMYPNVSNEENLDDAGTLQIRLDDLQLKLQQQGLQLKTKDKEIEQLTCEVKKKVESLESCKEDLGRKTTAMYLLKNSVREMTQELNQYNEVKLENKALKKNLETLNGLQQVFNATSGEVEKMLQSYTDIKTLATFASALKRALTESEEKKAEYRNKFYAAMPYKAKAARLNNVIADYKARVADLEDRLDRASRVDQRKRKASDTDTHHGSDTNREENATDRCLPEDSEVGIYSDSACAQTHSPYLKLQQGSFALSAAGLKPSEQALLNSARTHLGSTGLSIFTKKPPLQAGPTSSTSSTSSEASYDGLGGHSKLDVFPKPNPKMRPILTAKHKLKRLASRPAGNVSILHFDSSKTVKPC